MPGRASSCQEAFLHSGFLAFLCLLSPALGHLRPSFFIQRGFLTFGKEGGSVSLAFPAPGEELQLSLHAC